MHDKSVFAVKLREIRERRNLSGSQFAKLLGIAQTTYSSYETGKVEPSLSTIVKIAKVLNVSSDILLGIGDTPENRVVQSTVNGHNVNGSGNVVSSSAAADAEEISRLKVENAALKIKLEYATEIIKNLKK